MMASRNGVMRGLNLLRTLKASTTNSASSSSSSYIIRNFSLVPDQISPHTAKWMQDTSKKSPMELINEVPPIKVEGRIVACEGGAFVLMCYISSPLDNDPALGHPIEFICLDLKEPAVCKYCGLRYVQVNHHH